jgi:glutamate 5-kinase
MPKQAPLIIKIGSAVLTDANGQLNTALIKSLVSDMRFLLDQKQPICLVSSGAIGAGLLALGKSKQPRKLKKRQALAAIGQVRLMNLYQTEFQRSGYSIGQILLSHEDLAHRRSFLNTRATLEQLFELGVIPIVNENDTVSTEEIQFGDNDRLAVLLANVIGAEKVMILSATPGLLNMNKKSELIREVDGIDANILSMARAGNNLGSGGMGSKLLSLKAVVDSGKEAWLADGRDKGILKRWFQGQPVGTHFLPQKNKKSSKDLWMKQHLRPKGSIHVDEGAANALKRRSASLLGVGITQCKGRFGEGQLISIKHDGKEFARGMTRLSSEGILSIIGKNKEASKAQLGPKSPRYVIHRNDFVLTEPEP